MSIDWRSISKQGALRLFTAAALMILSGCSLFKTQTLNIPANMTAEQRAVYLQQLNFWRLEGRIGIIANNESESANISWQQDGEQTQLRIYGALGTTYALLHSRPGYAKIELPDDQVYYGTNAEQLLYQSTGWQIPVDELRQWIRGLHGGTKDYQLNSQNYVSQIRFNRWKVWFQKYQPFYGLDMPKKIRVSHPDIVLKFAIYDWEFTRND